MIEFLFAVALSQQQIHDQCIYRAGVASNVQEIRQQGDNWEAFKENTQRIYKDDEGYQTLLAMAYLVYHQVPIEEKPDVVFELMFDTCITSHYKARRAGPEYTS